jgi:diacylglycerol kinase family enzyme
MRVVALINERAGTVAGHATGSFGLHLSSLFQDRGITAECHLLPGEDIRGSAEAARERAARGEVDALVVGGGDGTIGTVASVLSGTGIPLGVLALGSLNHFAKDLGIPLDLEAAVAVISAGTMRAVDVAEVNGQVFVNNSSIGLYRAAAVGPGRGLDRALPDALRVRGQ